MVVAHQKDLRHDHEHVMVQEHHQLVSCHPIIEECLMFEVELVYLSVGNLLRVEE